MEWCTLESFAFGDIGELADQLLALARGKRSGRALGGSSEKAPNLANAN